MRFDRYVVYEGMPSSYPIQPNYVMNKYTFHAKYEGVSPNAY